MYIVLAGPVKLPARIFGAVLMAALTTSCEAPGGHELESVELGSVSQSLEPGVIARLTGERDATTIILADGTSPKGGTTGWLVEGGKPYEIYENVNEEANLRHSPLIRMIYPRLYPAGAPSNCIHGTCLLFAGYRPNPLVCMPNACSGDNGSHYMERSTWGNDRLEVVLGTGGASEPRLAFGKQWYLRFYIRFDPAFVAPPPDPKLDFIIHQVWQWGPPGAPTGGPPFAVYVIDRCPDLALNPAKVALSFRYRNSESPKVSGMDSATEFLCVTVDKGVWNNFHILALPLPHGPIVGSGILVWQNRGLNGALVDSDALNFKRDQPSKYLFYWGYPPEEGHSDTFQVRIGIYRGKPITYAPILFDSVKLTESASAMNGM